MERRMRGQFYIVSVVLLSAVVTSLIIAVTSEPRAENALTGSDLLLYSLERSAEDAVRAAIVHASNAGDISKINDTILDFTIESKAFARRSRASLEWDHTVVHQSESNATVTYTLWLLVGKTTIKDTFEVRKALEAYSAAHYLVNRTYLNVTVYTEEGPETLLNNQNFAICLNDTPTDFNMIHQGAGLYQGQYPALLGSGTYNISVNVTDPRQVIAKNSTSFTVS